MWLAIVLVSALAAGLLQVLPTVFLERAVKRAGEEFLISQVTHHGDTTIFYLPRAGEILEGHFPVLDLHVPDNRQHGLFLWPPGPQLLLAGFLKLADDENHAYMAAGFVMTLVMFLLFYQLGRELFNYRGGSLFFAAVGVLTPLAIHLPRAFFGPGLFADIVLKNFVPVVRTPLPQLFLARIDDPLLTLFAYILALALAWRFFREPSIKPGLALGLSVGLVLYFYLYYWLFLVALLAILAGYAIFWRGEKIGPWLALGMVAAILSLPYALNFMYLSALPQAADQVARIGLERGFGFRLSVWPHYAAYLAFGLLSWLLLRRRESRLFTFFFAGLAAMVLLWNIQLFIGFNLPPDHWSKAFGLPLLAMAGVISAVLYRRCGEALTPRLKFGLAALLVILAGLLVAKKVVNAGAFVYPGQEWISDYSFPQELVASWRWINANVPPESTILSNSFLTSIYLTGYTGLNPYLAHAQNTLADTAEVERRFLTVHRLFGTPPDKLNQLLTYRKNLASVCSQPCSLHTILNLTKAPTYLYAQVFNTAPATFDALLHDSDYTVPAERIKSLLERYGDLKPSWSDFSGAYVFVGPWERELGAADFESRPELELKYEQGGARIYSVRQ